MKMGVPGGRGTGTKQVVVVSFVIGKVNKPVLRWSGEVRVAQKRLRKCGVLQIHRFMRSRPVQSEMTLAKRPLQPRAGCGTDAPHFAVGGSWAVGQSAGLPPTADRQHGPVVHELGSFPRANTHFDPSVWLQLSRSPKEVGNPPRRGMTGQHPETPMLPCDVLGM
jgi:hypothetical protein